MHDTLARTPPSPGGISGGEDANVAAEASQDYMAAMHAMVEGAVGLEVDGLPTPGARPLPPKMPKVRCPCQWAGRCFSVCSGRPGRCDSQSQSAFNGSQTPLPYMQTEAQRWVEKLQTLYSSGAVVPLPFLRAMDACPLTLLGIDRGQPGPVAPPAAALLQGKVGREGRARMHAGLLCSTPTPMCLLCRS